MRFILISLPPHLPSEWLSICIDQTNAVCASGTHQQRSDYIKKHGNWGILKSWLKRASENKCWYCECKITRATFDVDHFRPKLSVTVDGAKLNGHEGYYWLAYDWSNFRLSCQRCNRPEKDQFGVLHGKHDEFPIKDEAQRCNALGDPLEAEEPRLLDPCVEADCKLLAHTVSGEVTPAAQDGTWEYKRAKYTIERLGFNEWNTPESKRSHWQTLAMLINSVGNSVNPAVVAELKKYISYDHEYSSFFRSAIGTHRDKAWVEDIL